MVRNLAMFCFLFLLLPSITSAQIESTLTFNGQNGETLKASEKVTVLKDEVIQVPSTCYRQVAVGETEVCRNVTRYRQECNWIPSSERCWNENDRVCRTVPTTRQVCSQGPSRRVCVERPSRRVCTDRPVEESCRTNGEGRRVCRPAQTSGENCVEVGGGLACNDVPGETTCRTVHDTEQQCDNVTRVRCETVPGRDQCENVPYQDTECNMETQYENEAYACTINQTVERKIPKILKAETEVEFITNGLVEEFPLEVQIEKTNKAFSAFAINVKLLKEPEFFVILKKKAVKVVSTTDKEIVVKASLTIELRTKESLEVPFPAKIYKASAQKRSDRLQIEFDGPLTDAGGLELKLSYKPLFRGLKELASLKASFPSDRIIFWNVGQRKSLVIRLGDILKEGFKKKMQLELTLQGLPEVKGEILNSSRLMTTKKFQPVSVELE